MKIKCYLLFLLFAVVFFDAHAQLPDSVQLNGEWRYIYPVEEKITFRYTYYSHFDLSEEEYHVWLEWKVNNDPRADLKIKELKPAIHLERIARKEISESEYYDGDVKVINFRRRFSRFAYKVIHPFRRRHSYRYERSKIDLDKNPDLAFGTMTAVFPIVPPIVRNLPDGKYVQYFEPRISIDKRKNAVVEDSVIACVFELSNNNLNGLYIRKEWNGDTLCEGYLKDGFQEGFWTITQEKSYNSSRKGRSFYTSWNTEERFYKSGVREGEVKNYDNGILKGIKQYKDDEVFGVITELNWQDSVVFDVRTALDPDLYNLTNFNLNVHEIIERAWNHGKYDLGKSYEYRRWDRELMKELSRYSNGVLLPPAPDSLFEKFEYARSAKYNPTFNSFYRVYDRKTKQLIFSRTLDTVANRLVGSSRRPSGELLDTISYNYGEKYLNHSCYDDAGKIFWQNGEYVIDSSKLKIEKVYVIDGFQAYRAGKFGYKLVEESQRNDTLFTEISWDKKKGLSSFEYVIDGTEEEGSVLYDGTAKYFSKELDHFHTFEYTDSKLFVQLLLNDQTREKEQKITLKGQAFSGELVFSTARKRSFSVLDKGSMIAINASFRNSIFEFRNEEDYIHNQESYPWTVGDFLLTSLLNVHDLEYGCNRISGNFQNGVFEGDVRFEMKKMEPFRLNYSNGLPNGNGTSRGYSGYMPYDHTDSLGNKLFETKRKRSSDIYVSNYTLKNGQLDGELKLFTTENNQFGSLNYKNGKLDGSFWLYSNNHKLTAAFKEGILIDNLQISRVSFSGADEYESEIRLSQTATGELLEGIYEFETYDNDPMMMYYQSKKEKWVTTAVGNGNYKTSLFANDVLYETRTQKNEYVTQTDIYFNGFLSHSKYYTDSARIQDSKVLVLRDLMNGADYFHSNLSRFRNVDLNLSPWEFDPYPAINLNFVQGYASENIPYYFKKYYPTGLVAREGSFEVEYQLYLVTVKHGPWKYYDYEGRKIREINYKDSVVNFDGREFEVKGSVTEFDSLGKVIAERFLLEEIEHYQCSSDDYYSERQYITVSGSNPNLKNGFVKNYYDNGALMNEGKMVNGVPDGLWKFYTPDGRLGRLGSYVSGQKNGKWLTGDLSEKAYIGDVCIDPNNPDYDVVLHNLEEDKEIKVDIYKMGALLNGKVYSEMGNTQHSGSNTF